MRETYPHLKISLAVGGWNEGSKNYSSLMAEPARRQRFVKSATDFIRRYKFDGLDLDWEYPTQRYAQTHQMLTTVQNTFTFCVVFSFRFFCTEAVNHSTDKILFH